MIKLVKGVCCAAMVSLSAGVLANPYQGPQRATPTDFQQQRVFVAHDCNDPGNLAQNCGFETGDFTNWVVQDMTVPFFPAQVGGAGITPGFGLFTSAPTEGTSAALHGFDGDGPGTIEIGQDVTLPAGSAINLQFDYRAAWDLQNFGATQDRTFSVQIEPAGGGAPLQTFPILTAQAGTFVPDTGDDTGDLDLSAFSGQSVRVNFVADIPENFSGPAFFQLDNVQLVTRVLNVHQVPTLSQWGLVLLAMLLAGGVLWYRRRSHRA